MKKDKRFNGIKHLGVYGCIWVYLYLWEELVEEWVCYCLNMRELIIFKYNHLNVKANEEHRWPNRQILWG